MPGTGQSTLAISQTSACTLLSLRSRQTFNKRKCFHRTAWTYCLLLSCTLSKQAREFMHKCICVRLFVCLGVDVDIASRSTVLASVALSSWAQLHAFRPPLCPPTHSPRTNATPTLSLHPKVKFGNPLVRYACCDNIQQLFLLYFLRHIPPPRTTHHHHHHHHHSSSSSSSSSSHSPVPGPSTEISSRSWPSRSRPSNGRHSTPSHQTTSAATWVCKLAQAGPCGKRKEGFTESAGGA